MLFKQIIHGWKFHRLNEIGLKSMFKRHPSSHMKLIGRSGYVLALLIPFISFSGDSKASTQLASENKLIGSTNEADDVQFNKLISQKILNFKLKNFLIAEELTNDSKKLYIKTCTKKEAQSGVSEEEYNYWNKCSMEEAEKSEQGRELLKTGSKSLSESCFQGI